MIESIKKRKQITTINIKKYFFAQLIIVVQEYSIFGLSKIRYINSNEEFIVDTKLITEGPLYEHTICIGLLGGF